MINETVIRQILLDIISSPDFRDAQRYQKLLTYLVDTTLKGESVKEITIAQEIFSKDAKFDPAEDPSIRVYISNLRKKLEHYFLTTDKKHSFIFEIPKGQYTVHFTPLKINKQSSAVRRHDFYIFVPVIILLISIIIYLLWSRPDRDLPTQTSLYENPIWREFFQPNSQPIMVVLGDYFFLFEKKNSPSGGNFVRDPRINTEEEFRVLLRQNPDLIQKLVISNFTYLRPSATWSLSEVLPILWNSHDKIYLKLASQFKWEDFQSHNVIFIGSFKTLYILKKLLPVLNLSYITNQLSFSILDNKGDTLQTFNPKDLVGGNYQKDYGLILKQVGPNNNMILFLTGFDEVGVIEAAKTSIDPNLYKNLSKKYNIKQSISPFLFQLVLEAEGIEQTSFKSELKYFNELMPAQITKIVEN